MFTGSEATVFTQFLVSSLLSLTKTTAFFFRSQIRSTLKKKAFEEAGVPIRQQQTTPQQPSSQTNVQQVQKPAVANPSLMGKSAEVTLNMLNAPENEVDVEGLPEECQVKLEFDGTTEEVTS